MLNISFFFSIVNVPVFILSICAEVFFYHDPSVSIYTFQPVQCTLFKTMPCHQNKPYLSCSHFYIVDFLSLCVCPSVTWKYFSNFVAITDTTKQCGFFCCGYSKKKQGLWTVSLTNYLRKLFQTTFSLLKMFHVAKTYYVKVQKLQLTVEWAWVISFYQLKVKSSKSFNV